MFAHMIQPDPPDQRGGENHTVLLAGDELKLDFRHVLVLAAAPDVDTHDLPPGFGRCGDAGMRADKQARTVVNNRRLMAAFCGCV